MPFVLTGFLFMGRFHEACMHKTETYNAVLRVRCSSTMTLSLGQRCWVARPCVQFRNGVRWCCRQRDNWLLLLHAWC